MPFLRSQSSALAKSPPVSASAFLQSIIPAPVFSRSSFTIDAETSATVVSSLSRFLGDLARRRLFDLRGRHLRRLRGRRRGRLALHLHQRPGALHLDAVAVPRGAAPVAAVAVEPPGLPPLLAAAAPLLLLVPLRRARGLVPRPALDAG